MTKKDLLGYILNGEYKGELPCGFWKHFPSEAASGKAAIDAHLNYYSETNVPIIKMMNEHLFEIDTTISCADDWADVKVKDIFETDYVNLLEEIKTLREKVGDDKLIVVTIHGLLVSACHATDGVGVFPQRDNTITVHLKENPEKVAIGLKEIAITLKKLIKACIEAGADGIYYAALGAEEDRFPDDLYETYVRPLEIDILSEAVKEGVVFLHICKENPKVKMFKNYPCHVVNWAEYAGEYTLEDGCEIFPNARILGGFDNTKGLFFDGSEEELKLHIQEVAERIGKGRIIIGADCTISGDTPNSRIKKIVDIIANTKG